MIPQVEQVNGFLEGPTGLLRTAPSGYLKRWLGALGVTVFDSVPYFQATANAARPYFPRDRHFTSDGNRVLADYLGSQIGDLDRLLPARRPTTMANRRR